ncbi:cell division protein SepF [Piscicoccus intestinalis]|uniref:cell division protein SepF n=1 Tax=Piscicoccus intestinalis TaxID=746033 RepID=UPI000838E28E|nr:cell division protein SepF [Piscicoccus intestinalis]
MAGALRNAMVYLGLAEEDDTYEEYDERRDHRAERSDGAGERADRSDRAERADRSESADRGQRGEESARRVERVERPMAERSGSVAHVASVPSLVDDEPVTAAPVRRAEVTQLPRRTPVREVVKDMEVGGVHRITTIHPRTYNEAKKIGESFREGTPVIMNLTDLDDADAKRLVDFAAGLVFGLQGSIERVTNKVFLLSPADVEVTSEDGEPTKGKGLFNQS